jgi:hypothetical protein
MKRPEKRMSWAVGMAYAKASEGRKLKGVEVSTASV